MSYDIGLLIMRLAFGGMMLFAHGWGKMMGWSEKSAVFPDPLGVGSEISLALVIFAEVICAFAVMVGMKLKFAVIPLFITMIVAAFVIHGGDPFSKKEFALMYAAGYAALFFTGSGRLSVDGLLR